MLPVGALLAVPVEPGREQAKAWAVRELARPEYQQAQPGLLQRALTWLLDRIGDLLGRLPSSPASALASGVALAVVLAVVGYALWRVGGARRQVRTPAGALFEEAGPRTPQEHRAAADRAAAAQDWRTAVLERFRAVVRELEERTVLAPAPGRTADEAAAGAAQALPELGAELLAGARLFDDVRYGDRVVGAPADASLRALDDRVRQAKVRVG